MSVVILCSNVSAPSDCQKAPETALLIFCHPRQNARRDEIRLHTRVLRLDLHQLGHFFFRTVERGGGELKYSETFRLIKWQIIKIISKNRSAAKCGGPTLLRTVSHTLPVDEV
jgi:hypothetical protein